MTSTAPASVLGFPTRDAAQSAARFVASLSDDEAAQWVLLPSPDGGITAERTTPVPARGAVPVAVVIDITSTGTCRLDAFADSGFVLRTRNNRPLPCVVSVLRLLTRRPDTPSQRTKEVHPLPRPAPADQFIDIPAPACHGCDTGRSLGWDEHGQSRCLDCLERFGTYLVQPTWADEAPLRVRRSRLHDLATLPAGWVAPEAPPISRPALTVAAAILCTFPHDEQTYLGLAPRDDGGVIVERVPVPTDPGATLLLEVGPDGSTDGAVGVTTPAPPGTGSGPASANATFAADRRDLTATGRAAGTWARTALRTLQTSRRQARQCAESGSRTDRVMSEAGAGE